MHIYMSHNHLKKSMLVANHLKNLVGDTQNRNESKYT